MDETLRKLVHLLSCLVIVGGMPLLGEQTMLMIMVIALLAGLLLSDALLRGYHIPGISAIVDEKAVDSGSIPEGVYRFESGPSHLKRTEKHGIFRGFIYKSCTHF
jgi:hypothetical protein